MQPRHAHIVWHPGRRELPPPAPLATWLAARTDDPWAPTVALIDGREPDDPDRVVGNWIDAWAVVAAGDGAAADAAARRLDADDVVDVGAPSSIWQRRLAALTRLAALRREARRRREAALAYFNHPASPPVPETVRPPVLFVGAPGPHKLVAVDALTGWSVAAYAETTAHARRHLETGAYAAVVVTEPLDTVTLHDQLAPLVATGGPGTPSFVVFRRPDARFAVADAHAAGADEVLDPNLPRDLLQRRLTMALELAALRCELRGEHAFRGAVDPISGRLGHSPFHAYLQSQLALARTPGTAGFVAVVLDNLDELNRTAGFAAGDRALAATGHALRIGVRAEDAVGRLDGASFGIWFADITDTDLAAIGERLRLAVARAAPGAAGATLGARTGWTRPSEGEDALSLTRRGRSEARRALLRATG